LKLIIQTISLCIDYSLPIAQMFQPLNKIEKKTEEYHIDTRPITDALKIMLFLSTIDQEGRIIKIMV
jgi:hypothetical protein